MPAPSATIRLIPLNGPDRRPVELSSVDQPAIMGRSSRCRVHVRSAPHESEDLLVSREHAILEHRGGRWFIRDISRHGTLLNSVRVPADMLTPLSARDQIRLGSRSFEVDLSDSAAGTAGSSIATIDRMADASRLRRVRAEQFGSLAQHRLDLLLECAEETAQLVDEDQLHDLMLQAAIDGSGYGRAALVRTDPQAIEVAMLAELRFGRDPGFSRSLLRAAMEGDVAVLSPEAPAAHGASMVELGIHQALCAPILIDGVVDCLLYLDSRTGERPAGPDAAAFCHGLCRIAGLARGNLQRQKMRRDQQAVEQELKSAQIIQTHLLPPAAGVINGFRYAMRLQPGRQVAGDLFDVFAMSDSTVAVCLGDVSGGGAGPGLVMAVTLAHLRAALGRSDDLELAVTNLNRYLCERTPANVFVSLWIGVLDRERGTRRSIDAGHGHWFHWRDGAPLPAPRELARMPLGIDETVAFEAAEESWRPRDRLILYSDGVSECHRRDDGDLELFGRRRVEEVIRASTTPAEDVERLFHAILEFCGEGGLADDTTAASIDLAQ